MGLSVFWLCPALSPKLAPSQPVWRPLGRAVGCGLHREPHGGMERGCPRSRLCLLGRIGVYDHKAL